MSPFVTIFHSNTRHIISILYTPYTLLILRFYHKKYIYKYLYFSCLNDYIGSLHYHRIVIADCLFMHNDLLAARALNNSNLPGSIKTQSLPLPRLRVKRAARYIAVMIHVILLFLPYLRGNHGYAIRADNRITFTNRKRNFSQPEADKKSA